MKGKPNSILTDLLGVLSVPHTAEYSDSRCDSMPFKSLYGLSTLLKEYGVESVGYAFINKAAICGVPAPFIAQTTLGLVIVNSINGSETEYTSQGVREKIDTDRFIKACTGNIFCVYPNSGAIEPDYSTHRWISWAAQVKKWTLWILSAILFCYLCVSRGVFAEWSVIPLIGIYLIGIYICFLLVQKTLKIHSHTADRMCGVIEAGGCDSVLETKASSFFGIFNWSEVGLSYFSVSLFVLLLFPQYISYLAVINFCCLPFSFWSVWYQKFRAKAWCTLCLCVQALLWLLFVVYLVGGWYSGMLPITSKFYALVAAYAVALLSLNRLFSFINRYPDGR